MKRPPLRINHIESQILVLSVWQRAELAITATTATRSVSQMTRVAILRLRVTAFILLFASAFLDSLWTILHHPNKHLYRRCPLHIHQCKYFNASHELTHHNEGFRTFWDPKPYPLNPRPPEPKALLSAHLTPKPKPKNPKPKALIPRPRIISQAQTRSKCWKPRVSTFEAGRYLLIKGWGEISRQGGMGLGCRA